MPFFIHKKSSQPTETLITPGTDPQSLIGKAIYVHRDGSVMAGRVDRFNGAVPVVKLALPDSLGVLCVTGEEFECDIAEVSEVDAVMKDRLVKRFDVNIQVAGDTKVLKPIKDSNDRIVDYLDVFFEGYASTFQKTTPSDRDGDYVMPTAFNNTLQEYRKNPIMLTDHNNRVKDIAGSFDKIGTDDRGLYVRGRISNSPVPEMVHKRFLIVEGHLKTLSMGGYFYYSDDGRGIEEVRLFENSLVAVPANPDALFSLRAITVEDAKSCMKCWTGDVRRASGAE